MTPQQKIKSFLKSLGYDVKVRKSKNMCADLLDDIIFFDKRWFTDESEHINTSRATLEKIYKRKKWQIDVSQGTFGIIHELGHILMSYTYKNLSVRIKHYKEKVEYLINADLPQEKRLVQYRNLTIENDADKMAYKVYKLHKEAFDQFDKEMQQLIKETYATA